MKQRKHLRQIQKMRKKNDKAPRKTTEVIPRHYKKVVDGSTVKIVPPKYVIKALRKYFICPGNDAAEFRRRFGYYNDHFNSAKKVRLLVAACGTNYPLLSHLIDADLLRTTDSHGHKIAIKAQTPSTSRKRKAIRTTATIAPRVKNESEEIKATTTKNR